jgi:MFS family permease
MLRQIVFDLEIPLPEGLDQAAWIVNVYLIAYVAIMPFIGRLSDVIGRKRVYLASLTLFLIGSIWVILPFNPFTARWFEPSFNFFLVGRVITAVGGGAMVPVSMAIIADITAPQRRASALGLLGAIDTAGWVWGPLYGALLVRFLGWEWQFYLNIPLTIIGLGAAWIALRGLPEPREHVRIDWIGAGLLTVALLALNVALLNSGDISSAGSFTSFESEAKASTLPLYLLAMVALIAFIAVQRYLQRRYDTMPAVRAPLIDLRLFVQRNFTLAVLINFIVGSVLIIAMVNVPLVINVLEIEVGQAALTSGWLLSMMTATMAIMAYLGGRATEWQGIRPITALGLFGCVLGFGLMGLTWLSSTPYPQMAWQLALLGAGFGLVTAPVGAAVINAAPENQRGIASSLVIVMRLMGMSVGLSGLTAWGLYRFGILRTRIVLPPITDPGYQNSLLQGLTDTTVAVLAETFVISALLALVALLISMRLRSRNTES